ncbi:MAG TPA: hypothetical protein VFA38_11520 [Nitrospirales bacterium]|nr:hypothetical protein [Nitrospirales bacterium]
MKLRRADWIFAAAVIAVIVFVSLLPTPRQHNPMIPSDAEHRAVSEERQCGTCHAPAGARPLPARHPKRQDCSRCHAKGNANG